MSVDFEKLRELLAAIAQTDITEFSLKSDDFELEIKKGAVVSSYVEQVTLPQTVAPTTMTAPQTVAINPPVAPVAAPTVETAPPHSNEQQKWLEITSPMVGTFYRAPAPDEPPFVDVGERIGKGDTVCIIEAMKLMNDIEAEVSGEVMEILVQNGEPVEFGQVLMRVNPG